MMNEIPKPPSIGKNVKQERTDQKLSLDELSTASGVSKAMLSQIESGKVNPTIATMWKIAHGLGVEFSVLMKGEGKKIRRFDINRKEDITTLDTDEEGAHISVLSPVGMAEDLELYLLTFAPAGMLHSQPHYPGTEEFLTVLAGKVKVIAGDKETILNEGDVLIYQCDIEHSIENLAEIPARIYLVVRFSG
jgi:XRE family transcriptional regulator, regulator of sulfur utilization